MRIRYEMNYKIIQVEKFSFVAVLSDTNVEIGRIEFRQICNYVQINIFGVKEEYRKQGIGKQLILKLTEFIKCSYDMKKVTKLIVYPQPYMVYNKDEFIDSNNLVQIYESLGFKDCTTSEKYRCMEKLLY